jgi:hypothetical protein
MRLLAASAVTAAALTAGFAGPALADTAATRSAAVDPQPGPQAVAANLTGAALPADADTLNGTGAAPAASAVTPKAAALRGSWKGKCYPQHPQGTKKAGGWCNGNGPNWQYWAYVNCSGGHRYFGPHRWMGDRRGSWVSCKAGQSYKSGGLYYYYYVNP